MLGAAAAVGFVAVGARLVGAGFAEGLDAVADPILDEAWSGMAGGRSLFGHEVAW